MGKMDYPIPQTRYGRGLLIVVVNAAIVRNTLIARLVATKSLN